VRSSGYPDAGLVRTAGPALPPACRPITSLEGKPPLSLDPDAVQWLALVGAVAGLLALVLAGLALRRIRRLHRGYTLLQADDDTESFVSAVTRKTEEVGQLRADVRAVQGRLDVVQSDLADALRHVAVVRYDAFGDMGGRLSFSVALLDDAGDGLVLTSINGRTETRTYSKGVKGGTSEASLSPEEEQAINFARRGRPSTS
jgi:Protein of unknown function (DUF4446)